MAVSIEDLLLAKAVQDQQQKPDPAAAMSLGAAGGALAGAMIGNVPHQVGVQINKSLDRIAPYHPPMRGTGGAKMMSIATVPRGGGWNRLKPGNRMAGGLVGAILGGTLGEGMRRLMVESSPAGEMLARIQAQNGQLSSKDQEDLQRVLADIYSGGL